MLRLLLASGLALSGTAATSAAAPLAEVEAAIARDDVAALTQALAQGGDPDAVLAYGERPLARAVEAQDPDLVDALLRKGAKPNIADASGLTPLALACERGNPGIVLALLQAGADARRASVAGAYPLAICAKFSTDDTVRSLLDKGAQVDSVDPHGQTPLMWAASAGKAAAVRLLLDAGAKVERVANGGFTPLMFAIAGGSLPAFQAMVAAGGDFRRRGPENTSLLQLALYQKNWPVAQWLVEHGGDLAELDRNGNRPLHVAAAAGQQSLVAAMLAKGADPDGATGPSRIVWVTEANFGVPPPPVPPTPPLLRAAQSGQVAVMRQLIDAGADRTFVAADGTDILLAAAASHSPDALALALSLVAKVDVQDANGATPLHRVLDGGVHDAQGPMLLQLARHGARYDIPDKSGRTAVQTAMGGVLPTKTAFLQAFPDAASVAPAPASR